MSAVVLLADDDAVTRRLLDHHLRAEGYRTILAVDGEDFLERLTSDASLALVDLQMPKRGGLDCLREAKRRFPDLPVLVISQFGEIKDAVAAMKEGAFDYITKPIDPDELSVHVRQALRSGGLERENRQLREAVAGAMPAALWLGESAAAKRARDRIKRVSQLDSTVLLTGESGTGKSTVARLIHQSGRRGGGPFLAVSCAALPRDLIEAELFGHAKGAFTGAVADRPGRAEMADGGTLFLDEIGDLPLDLQPKLLSFLQDRVVQRVGGREARRVDVRVIAATHQDLVQKCRTGTFRQDLYFRLNVLPIELPPLRERPEDIRMIAKAQLDRLNQKRRGPPLRLSDDAVAAMERYSWPGNVRELENVLERAWAFASGPVLSPADLSLEGGASPSPTAAEGSGASLAGKTLEEIERQAITETLLACGGNKRAAARALGVDEKTIYNKLKRLGLATDDEPARP